MKKTVVLLLAIFTIQIATAQEEVKKHNFGFGVSTEMWLDKDNHLSSGAIYDVYYENALQTQLYASTTLTDWQTLSLHFDYTYKFNKSFSLTGKFKCSFVDADILFSAFDKEKKVLPTGFNSENISVYNVGLEIPLTANYNLNISDNIDWTFSLGGGLRSMKILNNTTKYELGMGIEPKNFITFQDNLQPFLLFGTGTEFKVGEKRMKLFLNYSLYDADYFTIANDYSIKSGNLTGVNVHEINNTKLNPNQLELGFTYFF
ncbi:MAG: hypothetical protein UH543_00200 [Bacteroidales bacterium]|nr:hypothetical protein [Bacteroidales bacterium]